MFSCTNADRINHLLPVIFTQFSVFKLTYLYDTTNFGELKIINTNI